MAEPIVAEHPILFSAPMVRAIRERRKAQTRRIVKHQGLPLDEFAFYEVDGNVVRTERGKPLACPYGKPGDRLWVRETWQENEPPSGWIYRADDIAGHIDSGWRPSIFMPRKASRLLLEVTEVRVQRLQDISEEDAQAEGLQPVQRQRWWQGYRDLGEGHDLLHQDVPGDAPPDWMIEPKEQLHVGGMHLLYPDAKEQFRLLWDSINGKKAPWDSNPWVWAISFLPARERGNE